MMWGEIPEGAATAPFTGDASLAVGSAWPVVAPTVTRFAERLTEDPDDRKDLVQEAMIELWKADPTRYDLRDPDDVDYLTRILTNRMRDVWGGDR
jgi:DNA-directed RNA polymerase specialized sigma24 family protein